MTEMSAPERVRRAKQLLGVGETGLAYPISKPKAGSRRSAARCRKHLRLDGADDRLTCVDISQESSNVAFRVLYIEFLRDESPGK